MKGRMADRARDAPGDKDDAPPDDEPAHGRYVGSRRVAGGPAGSLADRPGGLVAGTLVRWTHEVGAWPGSYAGGVCLRRKALAASRESGPVSSDENSLLKLSCM